eukprot:7122218-Alexandrium_andersonii.AAC.1
MRWLIGHAAELLTEHTVGHAGRTPHTNALSANSAAGAGTSSGNLCTAACARLSPSAGWARSGGAVSGWEGGGGRER